jgi:hypothetical protein
MYTTTTARYVVTYSDESGNRAESTFTDWTEARDAFLTLTGDTTDYGFPHPDAWDLIGYVTETVAQFGYVQPLGYESGRGHATAAISYERTTTAPTTYGDTVSTLTPDNRAALLAIAETLWTARKALNASDVHGIDALATGYGTGSAYDHTTDALRAVTLPLVGGDEARAAEVLFLLADNYESVAYNLDVEARAHAERTTTTSPTWTHERGSEFHEWDDKATVIVNGADARWGVERTYDAKCEECDNIVGQFPTLAKAKNAIVAHWHHEH